MLGPRHCHRICSAPPRAVNVLYMFGFCCGVLDDVDEGYGVAQVGTLASYLGCRGVRLLFLYLNGLT